MATRRKRLVEPGGVECFEIRIVVWFDTDGHGWTSVDVSAPEGNTYPELIETLGAMELAKATLMEREWAGPAE